MTASRRTTLAEKPSEAVSAGISLIAETLGDAGLRLIKRDPSLTTVVGDLTFRVNFQSSKWNRAGGKAAISMYVEVASATLAQWRLVNVKEILFHREPAGSLIVKALIGNLRSPRQPMLEWDFSDKLARAMVAHDATATIQELALPFFDVFKNTQAAVERLVKTEIFHPRSVVEYATAVLGRETGQRTLATVLAMYPVIRASYVQAQVHLRKMDGSRPKAGIGYELAVLAASCGFEPL